MLHKLKIPKTPNIIQLAVDIDYYQLFLQIQKRYSTCFLFESLQNSKQQERFVSFGFDPLFTISARSSSIILNGDLKLIGSTESKVEIETENPIYFLRQIMPERINCQTREGCLVGNFGYEAVNYIETSLNLEEHPDFPTFELGMYQDGLIFDQVTGSLEYFCYIEDRSGLILDMIRNVLPREVAAELTEGVQTKPKQIITFENKITSIQFLGNSQTKEEHRLAVLDTIEQIKMGNTFQAEVGFKTEYKITGDKIAIYNELRKVNPSPYMYYLKFSERELFGCSPELLIACTKGRISTSPLAGTIHRGKDEIQDRQLVRKLLTNPKEIAEHKMLVDLHRNDIAKVSKIGSVKVADLMYIVKFSNVQHIASDITGELVDGKDSLDVLSCILPGGVLTGAPKIETIKIIAKNEKTPRGPYGGAVGRLSYNGDCAFALPIRSLFCNGDNCFAQTCGGIVLDSDPESEYQEIRNKLAAMDNTIKNIKI